MVKATKKKANIKLPIYTQRMLQLIEYVQDNEIKGCKRVKDVLLLLGFSESSLNNVANLRRGHQKFSLDHYLNAVKEFGVTADYFFNDKQMEMFPNGKRRTAKDLIKEGLAMMQ